MKLKISFLDFWGNFDPYNNFLYYILKEIFEDVTIVDPENSNLIIYSVFGQTHYNYKHCKKIFFTGENQRPNFNECDVSFTFDFNDYNGRNIRLPLWYFYIDWCNIKSYGDPKTLIPIHFINKYIKTKKTKFCATVFSKPIQSRFDAIEKIKNYKPVDCYGKIHINKILDGEDKKLELLSNYKFSICFENSIYPGYFTEKLLHAKIAGNVPLYYSDRSFSEDFNEKCCLNLINYENLDHFLDHIKEIDNNEQKYQEILNEPLFNKNINLNDIKNNIKNIINKNIN